MCVCARARAVLVLWALPMDAYLTIMEHKLQNVRLKNPVPVATMDFNLAPKFQKFYTSLYCRYELLDGQTCTANMFKEQISKIK